MTRRDEILDVCVEMADKEGFQNISLKTVADRLGIKPPSLYKHFPAGLGEIKESLMIYGWNLLDIKSAKAVVGKSL